MTPDDSLSIACWLSWITSMFMRLAVDNRTNWNYLTASLCNQLLLSISSFSASTANWIKIPNILDFFTLAWFYFIFLVVSAAVFLSLTLWLPLFVVAHFHNCCFVVWLWAVWLCVAAVAASCCHHFHCRRLPFQGQIANLYWSAAETLATPQCSTHSPRQREIQTPTLKVGEMQVSLVERLTTND